MITILLSFGIPIEKYLIQKDNDTTEWLFVTLYRSFEKCGN